MSDDVISLVLDASGVVLRVAVGAPGDIPFEDGETVVPREGAAAEAWIGWKRVADGSYALPLPVVSVPTRDDLIAYAYRARVRETRFPIP